MIVLDTNVISELLTPKPDASVEAWVAAQAPSALFTTAITQAEILYGLRLLPEGKRRRDLEAAVLPIFAEDFDGRILPFDSEASHAYAALAAARRQDGRPISQFDAQIAAIAICRGATIATRNVNDFTGISLMVVNPWES